MLSGIMYKIFTEREKNPINLNFAHVDAHNYVMFSVEETKID